MAFTEFYLIIFHTFASDWAHTLSRHISKERSVMLIL